MVLLILEWFSKYWYLNVDSNYIYMNICMLNNSNKRRAIRIYGYSQHHTKYLIYDLQCSLNNSNPNQKKISILF